MLLEQSKVEGDFPPFQVENENLDLGPILLDVEDLVLGWSLSFRKLESLAQEPNLVSRPNMMGCCWMNIS